MAKQLPVKDNPLPLVDLMYLQVTGLFSLTIIREVRSVDDHTMVSKPGM